MKRRGLISLFFIASFIAGSANPVGSIKQFIDNKPEGSFYIVNNEYLLSGKDLPAFYENRNFTPAWFDNNTLSNSGYEMLDFIRQAGLHGLQPEDYHLFLIQSYVGRFLCYYMPSDQTEIINLDLLLTDAFMLMGSHLYHGKVNPETEGVNWNLQRKDQELQLANKLENALDSNNVRGVLDRLAPGNHAYKAMKENMAFFLSIREFSWAPIITKPPVKPGESNQVLPLIRKRLMMLRYKLSDSTSIIYDSELEKQVKLFQNDWGLNTDGVIGKTTLEDLNQTPDELIGRLKVNMERFRWLQVNRSEKYIIVNIADFRLNMIKGSDTLISMRAIVGKEPRNTPVFSERLTYIVFNPTWTVPETILKDDVIPELLKGPQYLEKKKMKIFRPDGSELSYSDVDWSKISKNNFPYSVRQEAGPGNSLGKVKFMFPNTYDVYIHDTPSRELFTRDNRAVSSGCIRVEKPFDFAVLLLSDAPEWSSESIRKTMQQEREQAVRLKTPVDVLLVYLTAWTDGKERIQFRNDVYRKDNILLGALKQKTEAISGNSILW
jgi:L,D-transpeptidase YcbB